MTPLDPTYATVAAAAILSPCATTILHYLILLLLASPLALLLFGAEQATYRCDFCGRRSTRKTYPGERLFEDGSRVTVEDCCEACCRELDGGSAK